MKTKHCARCGQFKGDKGHVCSAASSPRPVRVRPRRPAQPGTSTGAETTTDVAARVARARSRAAASVTTDPNELALAIETARVHIPIQEKVVAEQYRTDFIILRKPNGRVEVLKESAWDEPTGNLLPWHAPVGERIGRVNHRTGEYTPEPSTS